MPVQTAEKEPLFILLLHGELGAVFGAVCGAIFGVLRDGPPEISFKGNNA